MRSPTRRAALAAGVAVLLVTAGCLGVTSPTDTSTSSTADAMNCTYDTTATATDSGTWSPNASVDQYPPGVADNGTLVNVSTLLDSHFGVTANTSMALRLESSREDRVRTLVHGPKRVPFYSTMERGPEGERFRTEFYKTAPRSFARLVLPNETRHIVYQNVTAGITAWTGYETFAGLENHVGYLLYDGNYTVNGTVDRGDRTLVELTVDEGSRETRHSTNKRVLVSRDGVVYDVNVSVVQSTGDGAEERFEASMSLNTDVEWCGAPSWVGSLPHLSVSLVEDGHAVEIRNIGGATLPANASFRVYGRDEPVTRSRIPCAVSRTELSRRTHDSSRVTPST